MSRLDRCHRVDDFRQEARRVLPRMVFDFVDGGAERELTLRANCTDFEQIRFAPRTMVDVGVVDLSTTLLGQRLASPLMIAPMGLVGMVRPDGDITLAQAAQQAGIPYVLSTAASNTIEQIAAMAPGNNWFQLYFFRDREFAKDLIKRARVAGFRALVATVDLQRGGRRERDFRNGFTVPPRMGLGNLFDMARKLPWLLRVLPKRKQLTMGNLANWGGNQDLVALSSFMNTQIDSTLNWRDLEWLRSEWDLPLILKGVLSAEDAIMAAQLGADAIMVSNHGGRQLDGAPSSISVVGEIVAALDGRAEVILDSGIRRGSDVVKALALGAKACMVGRPVLYGLATAGRPGVDKVLQVLHAELDATVGLLGRQRIADLDRSALRLPG